MKKTLMLIAALMTLNIGQAQASELRALNVQNAKIYTEEENNTEVRVNFDYFRNHFRPNGSSDSRFSTYNIPRVDVRQAFELGSVPVRIGLNTALSAGRSELETAGGTSHSSAFGFGNLGLTLEAGVVQTKPFNLTAYINQTFPWIHNDLLITNGLRPVNGANAYGFQTGALYQVDFCKHISWYGDVGYRFDVPKTGSTQHSLVYYNEAVLGLTENNLVGLSLGLLGNSVYTSNLGTDLRLVPGVISKLGDYGQLRVGFPLGINPNSPDFGVQVSYFNAL